jgi:hypothetical protein
LKDQLDVVEEISKEVTQWHCQIDCWSATNHTGVGGQGEEQDDDDEEEEQVDVTENNNFRDKLSL